MNFQINGDTYFLSLAEDERRWLVFVSTPSGGRGIPVYEDAPDFRPFAVVDDEESPKILN